MDYETLIKVRDLTTEQLEDIALRVCILSPEVFVKAMELVLTVSPVAALKFKSTATQWGGKPLKQEFLTQNQIDELKQYTPSTKINAIKKLREWTEMDLRSAKQLVEDILDNNELKQNHYGREINANSI